VSIERYERPLTPEERTERQEVLATYSPERLAAQARKDQRQAFSWVIAVGVGCPLLSAILWQMGMAALMALAIGMGLFSFLFRLARSNQRQLLDAHQKLREAPFLRQLQAELKNNRISVLKVTSTHCISFNTGDDDVGIHYFFQIEPQQFLFLHSFNFDGLEQDDPPATFEIHDEAQDPTVFPLSEEELPPTAHLVLPGSEPNEDDIPEVQLSSESGLLFLELKDGDLFNLSLAELLDNPMALLKTRVGNLWERP
jgi:hypothetical protein